MLGGGVLVVRQFGPERLRLAAQESLSEALRAPIKVESARLRVGSNLRDLDFGLIIEAGGRYTYDDATFQARDAIALAAQYQMAVGKRGVIVLGAFGAYDFDDLDLGPDSSDLNFGGRLEVVLKL